MYRYLPAIKDLEALDKVARAGSISTAARQQMMQQQTLSARVSRAEKTLGFSVFTRSPYGVTLTEKGAALLGALPELLHACRAFSAVVTHLRSEDTPRHLIVAVSNTVAELYYPTWAAAFTTLHPSVRMTMLHANSRDVRDLVGAGTADVGVVEGGTPHHNLVEAIIGSDELILAVPTGHPWAKRRSSGAVTAEELRTTGLLVREPGSGSRKVIEETLGQLAEPAGEFGSLSAQRAGILALGIPAIISRGAVSDQVALGRIVVVPTAGIQFRRPLSAVTRRGSEVSYDVAEFIRVARESGGGAEGSHA